MSTATKKKTTAKAKTATAKAKTTTKKATARKTTAKKATTKRTTAKKVTYVPTENEIRERAFQLFVASGYQHGHALENWLQAEADLRKN